MSYLIALVMVILLGALGLRWFDRPGWPMLIATVLAGVPILLALMHTVPAAIRLGNRTGGPVEQSRLARSICRDHLVCLAFMSAFLAAWLVIAD
jgi:hypothetical protein